MGSETIKEVDTIDVTPTWETMMGVILRVWDTASQESKALLRVELLRCACIADERNAAVGELEKLKTLWDESIKERRAIREARYLRPLE